MSLRRTFFCPVALLSVLFPLTGASPSVTDLSNRDRLVILVFGDSGTGEAPQYRVGQGMFSVCRERRCDLALMLGDNFYEDGIELLERSNAQRSLKEIRRQFDEKFERPYGDFRQLEGFHFWPVLGNHDSRKYSGQVQIDYSLLSELWRMPAAHYSIPRLPPWLQIYGFHTDTKIRRELNGLQVEAARRQLCRDDGPEDRWKLAFGHHPLRNFGHHSGDPNEQRARSMLSPLLRECGVDVYFAGHAHHQSHSTLDGFEHVIQGAAAKTKGSNGCRPSPHVEQRFFRRDYGFAVVEVDPQRLSLDFYSVGSEDAPDGGPSVTRIYTWSAGHGEIGRPQAACVCASDP